MSTEPIRFSDDRKYVLVVGNPVDGFAFYGPTGTDNTSLEQRVEREHNYPAWVYAPLQEASVLTHAVMRIAHELIDGIELDLDGAPVNSEYARAISEMTCGLLGRSTDEKDEMTQEILAYGNDTP